jgi:hypothetical protein
MANVISLPKPCYHREIDEVEPVNDKSIPEILKAIPRWLLWKDNKIPYQWNGLKAKVNSPKTWCDFDKAHKTYQSNENYLGIGFVLLDEDDIACIDIDHCVDINSGKIKPEVMEIIKSLDSYTEISVSGTGIHIFVRCSDKLKLPVKAGVFELYHSGRYIAVTGDKTGNTTDIKEVSNELLKCSFEKVTNNSLVNSTQSQTHLTQSLQRATSKIYQDIDFKEVDKALGFIPADDRQTWLDIGMALHSTKNPNAFEHWSKWSAKSIKFDLADCERVWASFNSGGITIATVFYIAKQYGYFHKTNLHERYIYITQENAYLDVITRELIKPDVLNRLHRHEYQGIKGAPMATNAFDNAPVRKTGNSEGKRIAKALAWLPCDELLIELNGETYANTYRGLAIAPTQGDISAFINLVKFICGEYADLVLDHMAFTLQHPNKKIRWQILLVGDPRTGKSLMLRPLIKIFGDAGISIDPLMLISGWADVWIGKKVVVIEEVYQPQDKHFFNTLKTKLANDDLDRLNPKGKGIVVQQNLYSMYLCTNHVDAIRFDKNEDKLLVIETPKESQRWSPQEYSKLAEAINGDMTCHILHYLLNRDVSKFNYGVLPVRTPAMLRMVESGKPDYELAIEELIRCQDFPFNKPCLLINELKVELLEKGYKCSDRSLTRVLKANKWAAYRGSASVNGHTNNTPTFYSISSAIIDFSKTELFHWFREQANKPLK